jgi:isochorismate hydrolase
MSRAIVQQRVPGPDDYIVLKPKHSAFYATPLDTLLQYIGVRNLILAGITTNACVMSTASDAYVRDLHLFVPADCVAALNRKQQRYSLELMKKNFDADTTASTHLNLKKLRNST